MSPDADVRPYRNNYEHLEDELHRLDLMIRLRLATLALQNQAAPETQASRVAYITPADVEWLLDQAGAARADHSQTSEVRRNVARLTEAIDARVARSVQEGVFLALPQLSRLFGLSPFEQGAIVTCLAPELRRKYDRLFAYLQDDITRKRPSVDLVLELLCETEPQCWSAHRLLSDGGALLRAGLLRKVHDPQSPSGSSGLAQFLTLDPRILDFLLGSPHVDARLAGHAQMYPSPGAVDEPAVPPEVSAGVWRVVERHIGSGAADGRRLVLYIHGPFGVGKRELVQTICARLGCALLSLDVEQLMALGTEAHELLRLAFREGLLQQAVLHLKRADRLLHDAARPLLNVLSTAMAEFGWLIILSGETRWTLEDSFGNCAFQTVALPIPDVPHREVVWRYHLARRMPDAVCHAGRLARQFRLTPGQVRAAVALTEDRRIESNMESVPLAGLQAACREQSNHRLRELAVKVEARCGWDDLVLPNDKLAHLRHICDQVRHEYTVFGAWGFGRKYSRGKGLSVLFTGPPGTGKTMAAEVLAHELELDLYKVDLSGVVSKYIGETEKNLSRIFAEAEASNVILFFDEADALFGKRTHVSDAHDRYANVETSYLLQKIEDYQGLVILATNLRENMDEAFTRRIRCIVDFRFPDEADRKQIWRAHFPAETPVSPGIDYASLARELQVAGGSIKNIVLNSAFLAAADGGVIGMEHILQGAKREFEKIGKLWSEQRSTTGPKA